MRKKYKIVLIICFIFTIIVMASTTHVEAMTGSVTASVGKTNLSVGESTKITVTATNSAVWYTVESSDSSVVSVSPTSGDIDSGYEKTDSQTHTLTAKKVGKATIKVVSSSARAYDEKKLSLSKTFTITVTEPAPVQPPQNNNSDNNKDNSSSNNNNNNNNNGGSGNNEKTNSNTSTKSSDATLKSITVDGKNYSLGTTMTVNADVSSVEIKATPKSSKASVSGTGRKELVTGTNRIPLTVTAEDGTKRDYTVKITRLAEQNDTPNVVEENPPEENNEQSLMLNSLVIDGVILEPEFKSDVFEYTVSIQDLEELIIDAKPNIEDANIEITGNTELVEGENLVIIKLTKDEKLVEYKIKVNKTIAPIVEEEEQKPEEEEKEEVNDTNKKVGFVGMISDWWNKSGPMTIVFSSILILLGTSISFAIVAYKYSGKVGRVSKHDKENVF